MNYQTVASKINDFMSFQAQIQQMTAELKDLEANPPKIDKEVLTWEEAVAFAESEKNYAEQLEKLHMGIANRQSIVQNKEQEIGEMLPVKDRYILFEIKDEDPAKIQTYKIGYFPNSYGFRMEKIEKE